MSVNMGTTDRILRILGAILLAAFSIAGVVSGVLAIIFWIITALLLVTGCTGNCPLYTPLKISTKKKTETK